MLAERRRRLLLLVALSLCAACTPRVSRLEPYRHDAAAQERLERRADEICCHRRGAGDLPPHRFTTDGCSFWPDGTWVQCCVEHDIAYWCGGSCEDRERADEVLRQCVAAGGDESMGTIMYIGVRAGGPPWTPLTSRWGYGWNWPHGYDDPHPSGGCVPLDGNTVEAPPR